MKTLKALKVCNFLPLIYFGLLSLTFAGLPAVASIIGEEGFMDMVVGLAFSLALGSGLFVGVWTLLNLALTAWHFINRRGAKPRPLYRQTILTVILAALYFASFGIEDRLLAIFGQDKTWPLNLIYLVILILSLVLAWPHNRSLG
ncbi:hypothetical protein ACX3VT_06170 [Aerococcus sanguinicola]|uniref:hypothetical protein n=1 Tax=unclassified Aerococcus TaxID=2618060 RepID=UPI0008A1ED12|nr:MULTISPECIES: hypothetical protein [unclassified Aerococcus]KAB0647901.1 hypothetical protein F6I01_00200 [Aerococcus sanguinicola]MDK6234381.1 hypothetical protein [Aerococcus sp. UMB10185]MDK6855623.1 hypothetical protein [Aerococcus sp. UMB7533]OFN02226.1 hypothetical protein HMPREF2626_06895 [Aerococcus sp. HMSC062A02]OHO42665.1 hypothetical protein HMPREF2705_02820 [Aerococcus sp. HMSC035B07]